MLEYIIIFITGLIFGSFLNVIIYRLPREESIVFPASHCPSCQNTLQAIDLIPVLSFVFYRGKCRYCKEKISWQYPFVELLTGILLLLLYMKYYFTTEFVIYGLLVLVLIAISVIDFKLRIIPNKITYPGVIIAFILSVFFEHITILSSLLGILIPAGLFLLIALIYQKGLGMGDVKLVALIGAVLGWQYTLLAIFIGSFIGAIIGITLILTKIMDRRVQIPFGPYISFGTIIVLLYGERLIEMYLNFVY
ncbi:MAG: prepilin peptidase [Halanaerobiales bacterium]